MKAYTTGNNRAMYDIIADILSEALTGKRITKLLADAKICFTLWKAHRDFIMKTGLLKKVGELYETTTKGIRFLAIHSQIQALLRR